MTPKVSKQELKALPCHWCNSEVMPEQIGNFFNAKWACVCGNCGAVSPGVFEVHHSEIHPIARIEEAKLDAIRAHNTRAQSPAAAPSGERVLRAALEREHRLNNFCSCNHADYPVAQCAHCQTEDALAAAPAQSQEAAAEREDGV